MNAIIENVTQIASPATNRPANRSTTDITRGARFCGIQNPQVSIHTEILEDYSEIDSSLGQNLVGVILSVLTCHLELNPGGTRDDQITVCVIRRDDAAQVELHLSLQRSRRQGIEHILLVKGKAGAPL